MSRIKFASPVIHTPKFNRWVIGRLALFDQLKADFPGLEFMYPYGLHNNYFYTDLAGVASLVPDLILNSNLYKEDIFTCFQYAARVWLTAAERYELNTWPPLIGSVKGFPIKHGFNLIMIGDEEGIKDYRLFEPNDGFDFSNEWGIELPTYQVFPVGEEGYTPEKILY